MNKAINKIELLRVLVENLGIMEPWVLKAVRSLQYKSNPLLESKLTAFIQQYSNSQPQMEPSPYILPYTQAEMPGELNIGYIIGKPNVKCRLILNALTKNILICGSVGSGKTILTLKIAEQALLHGLNSIRITDPKAYEFTILSQKYPKILILHIKNIFFNLFDPPPGMSKIDWYSMIVNHLSLCYNFWEGGESLILDSLIEVSKKGKVTLTNLYTHILHKKGFSQKDHVIKSTVLSRLRMLQHQFGSQIERSSDMLEALNEIPHIILVDGLLSENESWVNEYLLLWDFYYRKHNPHKRTLALRIYDECQHRLFNNLKEKRNHFGSATLISKLVDEARALSLGIIAISQEPSTLIKSILNNSHSKFCMRLGSGQEIKIASDAMGLSFEQKEMLHYLEVGEAVVKTGSGYLDPFPVKIDMFQAEKALSENEFLKHQENYRNTLFNETIHPETVSVNVGRTFKDNEKSSYNKYEKQSNTKNLQLRNTSSKNNKISDELFSLLNIWLNLPFPFITQGQIMKKADILSGSKQTNLKNKLIRNGLIISHKLQVGRTFTNVWEPSLKAYEYIDILKPKFPSKGGYLHQFIAHHVMLWSKKQGFTSSIEYLLENKKAVDVVVRKAVGPYFYEIVVSKPYEKELKNIEKDLETSLQPKKLIFLLTDNKAKKEFVNVLQNANLSDSQSSIIEFKLAGEFIVL